MFLCVRFTSCIFGVTITEQKLGFSQFILYGGRFPFIVLLVILTLIIWLKCYLLGFSADKFLVPFVLNVYF